MTDRPTLSDMMAKVDAQDNADARATREAAEQAHWERGAVAFNAVLVSMRQLGREFFTSHDYRVAETMKATLDKSVGATPAGEDFHGITTVAAPRDAGMDELDKATRAIAQARIDDARAALEADMKADAEAQAARDKVVEIAPATDAPPVAAAPPIGDAPRPGTAINLDHAP